MPETERNYLENREVHKEIQLDISSLETRIDKMEKEIIKFKIHLFYFLLVLQVVINPVIERLTKIFFP